MMFKMVRSLLWILLAAFVLQLQVCPSFAADQSFNIVWEQNGEEASDEVIDETEGLIKSQNPLNDSHSNSEVIHRTTYEYFSLNFSREITIPPPKA